MEFWVLLLHLCALFLYLFEDKFVSASTTDVNYVRIIPEVQCMQVLEGEKVVLHCTCAMHDVSNLHTFLWQRQITNHRDKEKAISTDVLKRVYQLPTKQNTKSLVINGAKYEDSGFYNCASQGPSGNSSKINVYIHVYSRPRRETCDKVFVCSEKRKIQCSMVCDGVVDCKDGIDEINCAGISEIPECVNKSSVPNKPKCDKVFRCSEKRKIPCEKVCDGTPDCEDGLDELLCTDDSDVMCFGKFRCRNGYCIHNKYVCDVTKIDHCGDGSDEENCHRSEVIDDVEIYTKDRQMDWLKTTVYTVIACTVAVVLLIAIIVVAIFRIRMKRATIRRPFQHGDVRRRHSHNCDGHGQRRALRNSGVVEHEPFISAPSGATFGNLIVNVNTGTHFIPSTEINAVFQGPPTYSEVLAECQREASGRHSPPPDYSTIDRNPRQGDTDANFNLEGLQDSVIHNTNNNVTCGEPNIPRESHSIQSFSANEIQITSLGPSLRPEGTNSLGRRQYSNNGYRNRQVRNVRAHPLPQRPKQLQVRNGQIVLDGQSSGSSSPETVNRNTQTTTHDFRNLQQALKQGQLQVDRGQVILSGQAEGTSPEASEPEREGACSVQGQLEVKDGHIIFKAS